MGFGAVGCVIQVRGRGNGQMVTRIELISSTHRLVTLPVIVCNPCSATGESRCSEVASQVHVDGLTRSRSSHT